MDVISDCSGMGFRLRRSDPEWEEKVSELQVRVRSGCRLTVALLSVGHQRPERRRGA